jgi:hypothetical protein
MRRALAVALLVGCGGSPPVTKPAQTVAPQVIAPTPPAPPVCIPLPDGEAKIRRATGIEGGVQFCLGEAATGCFAFDLGTSTLTRMKTAPVGTETTGARIETTNPKLEVCTGTECTSLTPKVLAGVAPLHATTNAAGTVAVVLLGDAARGKGYAEVWDVTTTKRLSSFKYARGVFKCGEVAMTGDTIFLSASTCGAPAARGALYTTKGKKIANIGTKDFGTFGTAHTLIEGTTWGFLEENGNRVAIQDVAKGKVIRTIDLSQLWSPDGQKLKGAMGNPGESAIVSLGNGKIAVIAGAPSTGKMAVVDVTTAMVILAQAPVCSAGAI